MRNGLRKILFSFLLLVFLLFCVMLTRALTLRSKQLNEKWLGAAPANDSALLRLAEAVRFRTVSYDDSSDGILKMQEMKKLHDWFAAHYPRVHAAAIREFIGPGSVLYTMQGSDATLRPGIFLAHLDVVPADSQNYKLWFYPPFEGRIVRDTLWGRGTMDDKFVATAMLEALEQLLAKGFQPKRSILFAFGHDEETSGRRGAALLARELARKNIQAEFVMDEGLGVTEGIVPGLDRPAAVIGLSEKGYASYRVSMELVGGHSSMPKRQTAISKLSRAMHRISSFQFRNHIPVPMRELFQVAAPEMDFGYKLLFSNLWITSPLIKQTLQGNEKTAATLHTTHVVTVMHAGVKENVIPSFAYAVVNCRIVPGETVKSTTDMLRSQIDDADIKLELLPNYNDPTPVAPIEGFAYTTLSRAIKQTYENTYVIPGQVLAGTDSRYYVGLTKNVYRFVPLRLNNENTSRIHGVNEYISKKDYETAIFFYRNFFSML